MYYHGMKTNRQPLLRIAAAFAAAAALFASCAPGSDAGASGKRHIAVTYPVLGSLVRELAGDDFVVDVPMPNGMDPHEWEPSARDIAQIGQAALVVRNGLGLEGGMEKSLAAVQASGKPVFVAADHIDVRLVKPGQGIPGDDADQRPGAADPHLWLDPQAMKAVVLALAADIKSRLGVDLDARARALAGRLDQLDARIAAAAAALPPERRVLVTGHESLGYFAERYGFVLVGAIVPSLSSQAEVSAAEMAALKSRIADKRVPAIFTELGTPPKVARALADELRLKAVPIGTHALPADGSYFTMMEQLSDAIVGALR